MVVIGLLELLWLIMRLINVCNTIEAATVHIISIMRKCQNQIMTMFSVRWHKHILQQNMEYWLVRKKAETIKRGTYLSKEELANVMKKGKINSMYGISCSNVLYSDY
jgi:hypothetical protein